MAVTHCCMFSVKHIFRSICGRPRHQIRDHDVEQSELLPLSCFRAPSAQEKNVALSCDQLGFPDLNYDVVFCFFLSLQSTIIIFCPGTSTHGRCWCLHSWFSRTQGISLLNDRMPSHRILSMSRWVFCSPARTTCVYSSFIRT